MSEWITIQDLGAAGMLPDSLLQSRPPNAFEYLQNLRNGGDGQLTICGGYIPVATPPVSTLNTIFEAPIFDTPSRNLVLAGSDALYLLKGDLSFADIKASAISVSDHRWTGGWLTGVLTLCHEDGITWTFDPSQDTVAQEMVFDKDTGDTWSALNKSAKVMRPFRNYMFAGYIVEDGTHYPTRLMWSDVVEPGQRPGDWVARDTNRSGEVDLADTPGHIVDMVRVRDKLFVLKSESIYVVEWVGGNQVFSVRLLDSVRGIHTPDAAQAIGGRLYAIGTDDIFVTDGHDVKSISWGQVRGFWNADRDESKKGSCFVAHNVFQEEILFFYASTAATTLWPDKALALSEHGGWSLRVYHTPIKHALQAQSLTAWHESQLIGLGAKVWYMEKSFEQDGSPIAVVAERRALFAHPGHDWIQVDRVKVTGETEPLTITLGEMIAPAAPVVWRSPFTVDPTTDYKTDARANGNQIAYKIEASVSEKFRLADISFLIQKSGERG